MPFLVEHKSRMKVDQQDKNTRTINLYHQKRVLTSNRSRRFPYLSSFAEAMMVAAWLFICRWGLGDVVDEADEVEKEQMIGQST